MEKVSVIAVKSFINAITGTVTKKQKLLLPKNLAKEFVSMGLVAYAEKKSEPTEPVEPIEPVTEPTEPETEPTEPETSQPQASTTEGGEVTPSVSLPVETALPTTTLEQPKRGRGRRAGR